MALVKQPMILPDGQDDQLLFGSFAFHVQFASKKGPFAGGTGGGNQALLGAFSEVSGLEASMEHKVVRQGGMNYGAPILAGPVSFSTVVLKRGVARSQTLWRWWSMFSGADGVNDGYPAKANRSDVLIGLIGNFAKDPKGPAKRQIATGWMLKNAMPVKFRVGDLNAKGSDVAIEELHLVHEGLHVAGVAK